MRIHRAARAFAVGAAAAFCAQLPAASSQADDSAQQRPPAPDAAAGATFFCGRLAELARWCDGAQLYVERNRVAEAILVVDPDHELARGWLGYRREKDGWKRGAFPPAVDAKTDAIVEWERQRDAFVGPMRETKKLRAVSDPKLAGLLDRMVRAASTISPDDATLRDLAGETRVGGKWVLKETAATPAGRRRIVEAARDARESSAKEKLVWSTDPKWLCVLSAGGVTVRSAYPKAASEAVGLAALGARTLFARAFDVEATLPEGFVVYVFADYWSHKRFLESRSDESDEDRKRHLKIPGYWLSKNELVSREVEESDRVDCVVRQVLQDVGSPLGRLYRASDWMGEGVGMYLTHALVGTRLTVFVQRTEYSDESVGREIADAKSDWVALARRMVEKGFDPKIPILVGTPLNSLTRDDGLFAYALAAYFLEARPADAAKLIQRTQGGTNFHVALAQTCRMDAEGLAYRFVRWLRETR